MNAQPVTSSLSVSRSTGGNASSQGTLLNTASKLVRELFRRDVRLAGFGFVMIGLFLMALIFSAVDSRTINDVNVWVKPMKFALSSLAYVWSIAWFLVYVPKEKATRISRITVWSLSFEIGLIVMQAARGVKSHFNTATPFDGIVFTLMGLLITVNTIAAVMLFTQFLRLKTSLPTAYRLGIQLGLALMLLSSVEGGFMGSRTGHSVGSTDAVAAVAGLPFLNWNMLFGDLRVAHFFGLHALQLLPLFGWFIRRKRYAVQWTGLAGILYTAWVFGVFIRAMLGLPLGVL
jgi:hypothetical protein